MIFTQLLKSVDVYYGHLWKIHSKTKVNLSTCNRNYCTKLNNSLPYKNVETFSKLSITNHLTLTKISRRNISYLRREYKAIRKLLNRSGLKYADQTKLFRQALHTSPSTQQHRRSNGDDKDKNDDNEKLSSIVAKVFLWLLTAYMLVAIMSIILPNQNQTEQVIRYVSWNEFLYQMLAKGEVEEIIVLPELDMVTVVLYPGAIIKGKRVEQNTYHINIIDPEKFEDKVREAERRLGIPAGGGVPIIYERNTDTIGKLLATIILASVLLSAFSRARALKNPLSIDKISQLGRAKFTLIDPETGQGRGVKFSDVAGLHEVKVEVMEIVDYLKRPEHYKELGAKVPKGALLLGPPGCGKTLLAKAVATEAKVPFLTMNGSEFIEMIGGLGAARVRDLFKEGRKRAPCIIYIDEIDALGRKRSGSFAGGLDSTTGEGEQTLNQLLVEMDGMASKEGVLMLASTNRADVLDKALLRPGRFDRHILIDFPTLEERVEIFDYHLKSITLEHPPQTFSRRLAHLTPGFSGADIANVVNEAALHAARHLKSKVSRADLEYAVERVVGGTEKRSTSMSPEEKRTVAVHESGHALVGWLVPYADILLKVTIVPRTTLALGFAQYAPQDKRLYSTEELLARMRMALGGRAAESVIFNRVTTNAQNDLKKVTDMAYAMVRTFGMNRNVGLLSFNENEEGFRPYSKRLASTIDLEARQIASKAYLETEQLLRVHRDKLDLISNELLKRETLTYMDIEKLIGPPLHGKRRYIDKADFEISIDSIVPQKDDNIQNKPTASRERPEDQAN